MKKSLSLLLAIALVFGMFSAVASAATPSTPAEAGQYLKDLKVLVGDKDGDLMEDAAWSRQNIVVLLARLLGKEAEAAATAKSHTFNDVPKGYYDGFISWAKEQGYVNGYSATKFGFNDELTVKDFSAIVLRALGTNNDATIAEDAVKAGIFPEGTDFSAVAKRGDTFVALVAGLNAEVAGTGKTLGALLGLPGFNVELAVASAKQTGAKKITVAFSRALTADEVTALKASVKNGLVNYPVTIKASEDKKSVDLEATFLPAQEYDVTINEFAAVKVTVINSFVSKVEIGANALQAADDQVLGIKVFNNFEEDVTKDQTVTVTAISSKNGNISSQYNSVDGDINLSGEAVDNTVVVSVTHTTSGIVASKTFKLVAGSSATNITLGQVAPKKDESHVYVSGSDYVLPITLKDQYGAEFKLPKNTVATSVYGVYQIGGISIVSSDNTIIDPADFATDGDSVLKFKTKAKSGTVILTVSNYATGAYATATVKVEDRAALKTFQLQAPGVIVVNGEDVVFPYVAGDTFGAPIANKDVPSATGTLTFTANGAPLSHKFKANGDLVLNLGTTGSNFVMALVNGIPVSNITVDVKAPAHPVSIVGTKDLKTTLAVYGSQTVDATKLLIRDNYGRTTSSLPANSALAIVGVGGNGNTTDVAGTNSSVITGAAAGSEEYTLTLSSTLGTPAYTAVTYKLTFKTIAIADVKTVTIGTVGTVYGNAANNITGANSKHAVELSLTGKTADGTEVAVRAIDYFDLVTSSDSSVLATDADPTASLKLVGKAEGTATVTVWKNGAKLNEQTVTVAKAAPAIATVKFTASEYTFNPADTDEIIGKLEIKDQYGVAFDHNDVAWIDADTNGKWFSSDKTVATVVDGTIAKVKTGIVTITYVSGNGISASITVNVD